MNMKKSIAGVMAGAMAVSAMATTASAWTGGNADHEQIEYVYDLATYGISYSAAEVKVVMNFGKKDALYYVEGSQGIKNADKTNFSKDVVVGANFNSKDCSSYDLAKVVITGTTEDDATTDNFKYDAFGNIIYVKDANGNDTDIPEQEKDAFSRTMKYYDKNFIGLPSDGSNENINIADSNAATALKDANGNQYAYQIQFAHSNVKKDYGAFILDNFAREDNSTTKEWVEGTDVVKTGHKVTAVNKVTGKVETIGYYEKEADADKAIEDIVKVQAYAKVVTDERYTVSTDANDYPVYSFNVTGYTTEGDTKVVTVKATMDDLYKLYKDNGQIPAAANVTNVNEFVQWLKANNSYEQAIINEIPLLAVDAAKIQSNIMLAETKYANPLKTAATWKEPTGGHENVVKLFKGYAFDTYTVEMTYYVMTEGDWNVTGWTGVVTSASQGIDGLNGAVPVVNFAGGTRSYYAKPMRTALTEPGNVINQLMAKKMQHSWDEQYYTYPLAVLNDMVANEENVEFVFTTAKGYVDVRDYVKVFGATEVNGKMRVKAYNPSGALTVVDLPKDKVLVRNGVTYADNKALGWYGISYKDDKLNDRQKTGDGLNSDKYWYHPYFSQHLYNTGTYGKYYFTTQGPNGTETTYDQFGSYSSAWNTNLFNSGLVFNSKWTMQLSDTDAFEWGDDYVVFHWDAAKEGKISVADFYIESMLMYTPVEWYWDTLKVAIGESMVYSVEAGAGEENDGDVVTEVSEEPIEVDPEEGFGEEEDFGDEEFGDEEFGDEEFGDEEFGDEEFGDEGLGDEEFGDEGLGDEDFTDETEPEETEPEQEVVVVVDSPKTGNSSVALAVIPVALAAAAIVAKKRK